MGGWCAHICRFSIFAQCRFVSDTIYRSRTGVVTPRSCPMDLSIIIIIIITIKHPTWQGLIVLLRQLLCRTWPVAGRCWPMEQCPLLWGGFWRANITWTVHSAERVSPGWLEVGQDLFPSFSWWSLMKENSDIPVLATGLNLCKCTSLFFSLFPFQVWNFLKL